MNVPVPVPDGLLKTILEAPEDDTPRLVLADWLEEYGDIDRAEFIRVQCELWGKPDCPDWCDGDPAKCNVARLELRERELLAKEGPPVWGTRTRIRGESQVTQAYRWMPNLAIAADWCVFRRGFVHSITLPWELCRDHLDAALKVAPIQEVTLTDGYQLDWHCPGLNGLVLTHLGRVYRCRRAEHGCWWGKPGTLTVLEHVLAAEWPGVKFHLPEVRVGPSPLRDVFRYVNAAEEMRNAIMRSMGLRASEFRGEAE